MVTEPYTGREINRPVKVFYSYSHSDESFRVELEKHLSLLRQNGEIATWYDRNISAGTEWKDCIDKNLEEADIILLLVSPDFLNSEYCNKFEVRRAMELHAEGKARVIPVILRSCDWREAPFGKLQALPTDAKPITQWPDVDDVYLNVVNGIREAVASLSFPKKRRTRIRDLIVAALIIAIMAGSTYFWWKSANPDLPPPSMMVSGFVLDSDGKGIERAQVSVEGVPGLRPEETGTSGKFTIDNVPGKPGDKIFIVVSKEGYSGKREPYTLNDSPKEILLDKIK